MTKREAYNLSEIGARLKLIRARQRLTQAKMAQELGISLSHYSKLEVGIGGMSHGLIFALCRRFGINEAWLVYGEGEAPDFSLVTDETSAAECSGNSGKKLLADDNSLALVESIIILLENNGLRELAEKIAQAMAIPTTRALAMLVCEKLRNPEKEANRND
ncbi:MAG: helix-turn-helix transcriptional regulator [Lentisphaerae bacterium]|jgi:transcriptional regulator with XRE-family HTH domain|nr:helix-turn-helix transcriptional regulator [Lentisphaerota bacterium]